MSLYARIILIVTALLVVTTGALSAVLILRAMDDVTMTSRRDVEATTTLLANANTYLLTSAGTSVGRNPAIQNLVDKLTGKGDIAFIRVVNDSYATLAASSKPMPGYDLVLSDIDWRLIARAQHSGEAQSEIADGVLRAAAPVTDADGKTRGSVFVYQTTDRIQATAHDSILRGILLAVAALVAGVLASMALARSITRPVQRLGRAAQALAQGDWDHSIEPTHVTEIHALGQAFTSMAAQLKEMYSGLETKVEERTRDLERRAKQIATSSQVARDATAVLNPEQLIAQTVHLIQEQFGFYYVGLFLIDEDNRYAVLQSGSGEAGRTMREQGHRLEVGGKSMVGWACANQQARIALDVGKDAVRFTNPLLPDTRSEMALPLRAADRVIGALDVQSTQEAAFDDSDIAVLQGMADQIAVAVENARLFNETQRAVRDLDETNRLLAHEGWQTYQAQTQEALVAEFCPAVEGTDAKDGATSVLHIPLELRSASIGTLALERPAGSPEWTPEETEAIRAIAQQTVLAAENARLFEQTQRTLDETRALYETSREITSAGEMEDVLKAVLNNLARTGIDGAAAMLFDTPSREGATCIEVASTWDRSGTPPLPVHASFAIADSPLFQHLTGEAPFVSNDVLADPSLKETDRQMIMRMGFRAIAMTPLRARGQWIGVLFAVANQARTFTSSELGFHRALADQAAVAIDNHRLLAETQRRAARERLINEITARIRSSVSLDAVLNTAAREIGQAVGATQAIIDLELPQSE